MTLEKLNYLIILAEEKNVTRAAKRLFITQPTLTTFINNLEKKLGIKLFDRFKNPVVLTRSGKIYIETMKKLLIEEHQLGEDLRMMEHPQQEIKIGIGQIHSEMWMPDLVYNACHIFPSLNFTIHEGQELNIMEMLKKEEIDIFFGHIGIDNVNYHFEELCEEQLTIVMAENLFTPARFGMELNDILTNAPQNPFRIKPEALSDIPLIEPASSLGLFLNLKCLLEQYQIHPIRIIKTSNVITAAAMVKKGLGYMYLSPVLCDMANCSNAKKLFYFTLPQMQASRKYYAAYREENPNINIIKSIITLMKTKVIELPYIPQ